MALRNTLVLGIALALAACGASVPQAEAPTPQATAAPASPTVPLPTGTATPPAAPTEPPAAPAPTEPPAAASPAATSDPSAPTPLTTPTPPLFLEPTAAPGSATAASPAPTEAASAPAPAAEATAQPAEASGAGVRRDAPTGQPVRLVIGGIDLDRKLVPVGLDANRLPVVPNHDIGWYTLSAQPGQGENVVLWGHVLRFRKTPDIPAPFARLKELKPGDPVELYDAQGASYRYVVTEQVWATPDQVEYMLPRGREQVTMISCIGDKVIEDGSVEMTHRLITIAEPEEQAES